MSLNAGDVVVLKSDLGGQRFTLGGSVSSLRIINWFDYNSQEMKSFKINPDSIIKIES
ncbi:hypothetical protein [Tenacibaculum finnmarkense]|uniref:hypothetical protein n=1 Tax=Tenacibaculum finnmarkense TaxID=2781243 RepID=UPI001EFB5C57|nr:hypothetical protein [Tenacibaculum finnmarkense]MCG8755548.1 hypothetical protein [Tenacibaculum finnmarkense]MCG8784137.1 hypothetical protein [Tenacibaculum finnmarkense]